MERTAAVGCSKSNDQIERKYRKQDESQFGSHFLSKERVTSEEASVLPLLARDRQSMVAPSSIDKF